MNLLNLLSPAGKLTLNTAQMAGKINRSNVKLVRVAYLKRSTGYSINLNCTIMASTKPVIINLKRKAS